MCLYNRVCKFSKQSQRRLVDFTTDWPYRQIFTGYMCFDHVVRYAGVPANEATVWVSLDYTSGLPSTATWTQIPTNFTNASTWDFYNSGDLSLSAYANKKIRVAFKYTSTATQRQNLGNEKLHCQINWQKCTKQNQAVWIFCQPDFLSWMKL